MIVKGKKVKKYLETLQFVIKMAWIGKMAEFPYHYIVKIFHVVFFNYSGVWLMLF